jgi:phosphate-selective porin OprO/OprP
VQDAYVNVHYWDCFQVEAGKFKQPFSYEQLIQDRYVPTAERSLIDQLVPARDEGVMIHGRNLLENRLDYAVSVSNGEINGDIDTNGNKDLVGRLAVRPFRPPFSLPFLEGLQVGISATIGKEQESLGSVILRTPAQVPWFQFNSAVRADGMRTRYSPELVYFFQGFGIATQYLHEDQQVRPNSVGPSSRFLLKVPYQGFYVMSTLLLTGEERTDYSQPIAPLRNFDPLHPLASPGAIELVARISKLHVNSKVFTPGVLNLADPTKFSDGATECTVGFNWYLTKWVRMQANWEHAWFDQPVLLGTGPFGKLKEQDTIITRLQVIF